MVRDVEIGWLAGLIDGEGSITMSRRSDSHAFHVWLAITNTNVPLLERAMDIIRRMGAEKVYLHNNDNRHLKTGAAQKRPCYRIYVGTLPGITTILNVVLPQLTAKRMQAELVLEYSAGRSAAARKRANARDAEIAKTISDLNRGRLDSVETARAPRNSEMTQSDLHGDMQRAAETTAPTTGAA